MCCCHQYSMFGYVLFGWSFVFVFKQKTEYEMRISDWSSDVCSSDLAAFAHFLVAGIKDQIRERLVEAALGKGRQAAIELLVDRRDRRGREGMAAQLFGDRLDLARRNALDIHLGQRRHQRLLRPLVALEQLGREAPGTVLRHPQLQLADPRHQRARVMPRTVAEPRIAALAL